jgi:hypothetical protein
VAVVPPSPPCGTPTAPPQPPKVQLPAKSPLAAIEVAAASPTPSDVAKAPSRHRSRSRSRVHFSEALSAAAEPAAVLTPLPPPTAAASAPDEPTSSPSGHPVLRRCLGTTGSSIVSLRSVEVLELHGRTLARVWTKPGAIDAQYARKPNRPAGAWLEYDIVRSRGRKRCGALAGGRVRQAVTLRPPTKHDRALFGAQMKSDEVWQILPIGEPVTIASC